jgi:hypothetical protein
MGPARNLIKPTRQSRPRLRGCRPLPHSSSPQRARNIAQPVLPPQSLRRPSRCRYCICCPGAQRPGRLRAGKGSRPRQRVPLLREFRDSRPTAFALDFAPPVENNRGSDLFPGSAHLDPRPIIALSLSLRACFFFFSRF